MTRQDGDGDGGEAPRRRVLRYDAFIALQAPVERVARLDGLTGSDERPRTRSAAVHAILQRFVEENENLPLVEPERVGSAGRETGRPIVLPSSRSLHRPAPEIGRPEPDLRFSVGNSLHSSN